jgi:hypothetical protein
MIRPRVCMRPLASLRPLAPLKPLSRVRSTKWRAFKRFRSCKAILETAEKLRQAGADHDSLDDFFAQLAKRQPKLFVKLGARVLLSELKKAEQQKMRKTRHL